MKKREEMVMFKPDEETSVLLENIKEILPMYKFEKEIPPLLYMDLATIATSLCEITNEETSEEEKIGFFLNAHNVINGIIPSLYLLMMDVGISDIFTVKDGIIVLKEEYLDKLDSKILSFEEEK